MPSQQPEKKCKMLHLSPKRSLFSSECRFDENSSLIIYDNTHFCSCFEALKKIMQFRLIARRWQTAVGLWLLRSSTELTLVRIQSLYHLKRKRQTEIYNHRIVFVFFHLWWLLKSASYFSLFLRRSLVCRLWGGVSAVIMPSEAGDDQ